MKKLIYIITPILLFILLSIFIKIGESSSIEEWAYVKSIEYMSPILTSIIKFITHIGDTTIVILLCLILSLIRKTKRYGILIGSAIIVSTTFNVILKHIFVRERPDILRLINETSYSFPSGHAMVNSTFYTMIILITLNHIKNKHIKMFVTVICCSLILLIGYSRIYLGVHYLGDVIGGWLLGFVIAFTVYNIDISYRTKHLKKSII